MERAIIDPLLLPAAVMKLSAAIANWDLPGRDQMTKQNVEVSLRAF
jgi:hypothetical protein